MTSLFVWLLVFTLAIVFADFILHVYLLYIIFKEVSVRPLDLFAVRVGKTLYNVNCVQKGLYFQFTHYFFVKQFVECKLDVCTLFVTLTDYSAQTFHDGLKRSMVARHSR